jgi:TRAP-type uncharacterized transport system substrate-binding protein
MRRYGLRYQSALFGALAALLLLATPSSAQNPPKGPGNAREPDKLARVNEWTVGLAGGFFEGTFIRYAAELAKALDDGDNLRILPLVSYGGNENIRDLLYLKGIDLAIAYTDTLELHKKSGQAKNIEQRINYISELLTGELYIFARPEIKKLQDLDGKKVSLGIRGGSATTTGPIVFERLGINPEIAFISNTVAIEKMKTGEIDAIVHTGGKPNDLFVKLKPEPGFHFVPIEFSSKFADYYLPCKLTHDDYPNLIKPGENVETLCMLAVLAVYNWPRQSDRFRRVERFIQYYFERFDKLKQPSFHPKWKDINLSARVPGWNRYWVAEEKVAAMGKASPPTAGAAAAKYDPLFQEFTTWREKQRR